MGVESSTTITFINTYYINFTFRSTAGKTGMILQRIFPSVGLRYKKMAFA